MNSLNYEKVIDELAGNSRFLVGADDIISRAKRALASLTSTEIVNVNELYVDKVGGEFVKNKYTSYVFNCNIMDTTDADKLFTIDDQPETEILMEADIDFSNARVGDISQSIGFGYAILSEQIRDAYDDMLEDGLNELTDFIPEKVTPYLGGLASYDFISAPSETLYAETDQVRYHRDVVNKLIDNRIKEGERVLFVGGDGGSASKRRRSYFIDCLYFSEHAYKIGVENRLKFRGSGEDYFYDDIVDKGLFYKTYSFVMFNFITDHSILDELQDYYYDSDVMVCGFISTPSFLELGYPVTEYANVEEMRENIKTGRNHSIKGRYKILGFCDTHVAVFCDHAVWIDERYKIHPAYFQYSKKWIGDVLGTNIIFSEAIHSSLLVLSNYNTFPLTLNFASSFRDIDDYNSRIRELTIVGKRLTDGDSIISSFVDMPDCHLKGTYNEKNGTWSFVDCDLPYAYWIRRDILSQKLNIDSGDGMLLDIHRSYYDAPLDIVRQFSNLEVTEKELCGDKLFLPELIMGGVYFHPAMKRWIYDDKAIFSYLPCSLNSVGDKGVPVEVIRTENYVPEPSKGEFSPVDIGGGFYFVKVDEKKASLQHLRLYGVEQFKYPDGVYCANYHNKIVQFSGKGERIDRIGKKFSGLEEMGEVNRVVEQQFDALEGLFDIV